MTQRLLQLDQVSFNLPDGRVLFEHLNHTFSTRVTGIVGANGCGKSLLGRLLTGGATAHQRHRPPRRAGLCGGAIA